jgi:phosphoenolpyruvate-protein phosphotransferase (PTS system enzyme I)
MTFTLQGIGASKGIAIGKVHVIQRGQPEIHEYTVWPRLVQKEVARFEAALDVARGQLQAVMAQLATDGPTEASVNADVSAFIDTHLLMLDDAAVTTAVAELIRERRCNAEWALKIQRDAVVSVFEAMDDPYLRARKDDIDQVVRRVQHILLEQVSPHQERGDGRLAGRVVFADDLSPADMVLMHRQGIAGFLAEYGGSNSHTAILARSLRIPAIAGLHQARQYLRDDELVVVDGRQGILVVDPDDAMVRHYRRRQREIHRYRAARSKMRRAPAITRDGQPVVLQANVELPGDIDAATQVGAEGIGLYRTEYLFMNRPSAPDEEEQYAAYSTIVKALRGGVVTIRTLDLGADKQVDGSRPGAPTTLNPALGLRAVRLCLREPALFRPQLRAILRASVHGKVRLMVPMLSSIHELHQVLRILEDCRRELIKRNEPFDEALSVGAMIEVPAAAICADLFSRHLDFMSIGTNDLIQYTIAIDRVDDEVNYLYDPLNSAVLRLIRTTIKAGQSAGIPVAMCGEMAGDARYTRLLLGMGLSEFSVHPNNLLEIKQVINESDIVPLRKMSQRVLRATASSTRCALLDEMNHGNVSEE